MPHAIHAIDIISGKVGGFQGIFYQWSILEIHCVSPNFGAIILYGVVQKRAILFAIATSIYYNELMGDKKMSRAAIDNQFDNIAKILLFFKKWTTVKSVRFTPSGF